MIRFYVTSIAIGKAISSSFFFYSIISVESPQLLKSTFRAFHWVPEALDQALEYFFTNKLDLFIAPYLKWARALHV